MAVLLLGADVLLGLVPGYLQTSLPSEAGLLKLSMWLSVEQKLLTLIKPSLSVFSFTVVPSVLLQKVTSKPKVIWLFSWVMFPAFYGFEFCVWVCDPLGQFCEGSGPRVDSLFCTWMSSGSGAIY